MTDRRTHTEILQVTAHDMATTRPLEDMDDEQLDTYFWGELRDPKGTYRRDLKDEQS